VHGSSYLPLLVFARFPLLNHHVGICVDFLMKLCRILVNNGRTHHIGPLCAYLSKFTCHAIIISKSLRCTYMNVNFRINSLNVAKA
jgi:hypothetical protein